MAGRLELVLGCMFAGKTTLLIERLREAEAAGLCCGAFKHASDRRYDAHQLATHDQQLRQAAPLRDAGELAQAAAGFDVVGLDELHFFDGGLLPVVAQLRARQQRVILVGLEFDAWGQRFPWVTALKAMADRVDTLSAPCTTCGAPAVYSMRVVPLAGTDMVGGPGQYEPRCPTHFEPLPPPAPRYQA